MYHELLCEWKGYADSIWHDVAFYHQSDKTFWNGEQQIENVIKWAYVDEMLEKQSNKEEPQVYKTKDGEVITYSKSEGYKVVEK